MQPAQTIPDGTPLSQFEQPATAVISIASMIADLHLAMRFGVLGRLSENLCPDLRSKPAVILSIIDLPPRAARLAQQDHVLRLPSPLRVALRSPLALKRTAGVMQYRLVAVCFHTVEYGVGIDAFTLRARAACRDLRSLQRARSRLLATTCGMIKLFITPLVDRGSEQCGAR